jgi:hypothetical protein
MENAWQIENVIVKKVGVVPIVLNGHVQSTVLTMVSAHQVDFVYA